MVVLKAWLTHSYRKVYGLDHCGALSNGCESNGRCRPARHSGLWWECSSSARRQAKKDCERERAKCHREQDFAEGNSNRRSACGTEEQRTIDRNRKRIANIGANSLEHLCALTFEVSRVP